MPVRERRARQHRLQLTRAAYLALMIGPEPGDLEVTPVERLREIWIEHRSTFPTGSWAVQFWEFGHDLRQDDPYDPDAPSGCPGT